MGEEGGGDMVRCLEEVGGLAAFSDYPSGRFLHREGSMGEVRRVRRKGWVRRGGGDMVRCLEEVGGLAAFSDYLVEDFFIGKAQWERLGMEDEEEEEGDEGRERGRGGGGGGRGGGGGEGDEERRGEGEGEEGEGEEGG